MISNRFVGYESYVNVKCDGYILSNVSIFTNTFYSDETFALLSLCVYIS
jgi:hypothetical protein